MTHEKTAIRTTWFSILGNAVLALIKGLSGIFGHSYALIADAVESTADIMASLLVLVGLKYANKPADDDHPYGHGKAEPLLTFVVVFFLISSAIYIAYQSITNINTPHELPEKWTLIVLGIIILWKEISYQYVIKKSRETGSSLLKAEAWHHRSDAITSITAFVGISIALIGGVGYESADNWAALVASAIILYNSYQIFRPALSEVMDEHKYDDFKEEIRKISQTVDGALDIEKCYIRKAGLQYFADIHLTVSADISVKKGHEIAHHLKDAIQAQLPQFSYISIHVEPDDMPCAGGALPFGSFAVLAFVLLSLMLI